MAAFAAGSGSSVGSALHAGLAGTTVSLVAAGSIISACRIICSIRCHSAAEIYLVEATSGCNWVGATVSVGGRCIGCIGPVSVGTSSSCFTSRGRWVTGTSLRGVIGLVSRDVSSVASPSVSSPASTASCGSVLHLADAGVAGGDAGLGVGCWTSGGHPLLFAARPGRLKLPGGG